MWLLIVCALVLTLSAIAIWDWLRGGYKPASRSLISQQLPTPEVLLAKKIRNDVRR